MTSLFDSGAHDRFERRLAALTPGTPARWGRMNAHQAVCHLSDSFALPLGEVRVETPELPWHLRSRLTRFMALTLPIPWPRGVPTAPELDQAAGGGTPPGEFERDVATLRDRVARFVGSRGRGLTPHPVFGELGPAEWGRWGWRHADHHLRQFGV
jgi:hypothetical protein